MLLLVVPLVREAIFELGEPEVTERFLEKGIHRGRGCRLLLLLQLRFVVSTFRGRLVQGRRAERGATRLLLLSDSSMSV